MNNNKYISTLKSALSGMDKSSRNDIIQEIQSHAKESGDTLLERFGPPDELARQYLEGEVVAKPLSSKIWGVSKKVFIAIGAIVVALIVIGILLVWWSRLDAFDYSNESAAELNDESTSWMSEVVADTLDIRVDQASVVFYWHDEPTVRHSCKGTAPASIEGASLVFNRSKCLVFLPNLPTSIKAHQSELVMVRPQQSLDLDLEQSQLEIAENGTSYRYSVDATRTRFNELSSVPEAELEIRIKSTEATISEYTH